MLSFVIPTHDRHGPLAETLERLGQLDALAVGGEAELIVIDNNSTRPVEAPRCLANGLSVELIRLDHNAGAAARNVGAAAAKHRWIVMLDDDSSPEACGLASALDATPPEVAAVGGEILLPSGDRESGGLPEVVIGCGCAIRRDVFLAVGGYDPSFDYYVEEYDLCARLIRAGHRVAHTRSIRFEHRKVIGGRSFDRIVHRLVRNNGWTIARYAPDALRDRAMRAMIARYREIAQREGAERGFESGRDELERTLHAQPRRTMTDSAWDRFIGAAAARCGLRNASSSNAVRIVDEGKGADVIRSILQQWEVGVHRDARVAVIGTLSPGPMLDSWERHSGGALAAWSLESLPCAA
ncbi:MAG: glycosyltransferase [Planctomycetota bacterium]